MKLRYSELKRALEPITSRMLSVRLRELENEGLIDRSVKTRGKRSKRCDYGLTECGKDFVKVALQMKDWALKWRIEDVKCEHTECNGCPRK